MKTDFVLGDLVPPSGFIRDYIAAATRLCDAPGLYHLGCILSAFSACVSPRCTGIAYDPGRKRKRIEPLFLWVFLLGESRSRKTEAVRKVKKLVLCPELLAGRVRSAFGSRAGLIKMLREEPNPWVLIEEAPVWFRSNRAAYMHDGAATWCEIYDGQVLGANLIDNVEENREGSSAPEVQVSLLATGATPKVMRATRPDDWDSGLLARVAILTADPPDPPRPGPYSWPPRTLARLRERLCGIIDGCARAGSFGLEDDAGALWDGWLLDLGRRTRGIYDTHAIMLGRLPAFALRIAILYGISRGARRAGVDDMSRALALADVGLDCVLELDLH